jgi:thiamine-phosphate pyrophosphorylase
MKQAPARDLLEAAVRLRTALAVPLFVNDRVDVALAAGADGAHLGAEDLPATAVRQLAPPPFRIGVSVGTPAEAEAASGAEVDYWSVGSVFATASKADAGAPIGIASFQALRALAPPGIPVIAIGGIDASKAARVIAAGAAGVAVISAIFAAQDIEAAARKLREAVDEARARSSLPQRP